ncbi:MAG: putative quinol monooxygenase [Pseudomonadota bacterium]
MNRQRRTLLAGVAATLAGPALAAAANGAPPMYGLIGKMTAKPGQRDALIAILLDGISGMPGCLSYVVAQDPADPQTIWITEVWDSQASHQASLALPSVREAIAKARPILAGMAPGTVTTPVGGHGLVTSS